MAVVPCVRIKILIIIIIITTVGPTMVGVIGIGGWRRTDKHQLRQKKFYDVNVYINYMIMMHTPYRLTQCLDKGFLDLRARGVKKT